jgi:hypothetical protein
VSPTWPSNGTGSDRSAGSPPPSGWGGEQSAAPGRPSGPADWGSGVSSAGAGTTGGGWGPAANPGAPGWDRSTPGWGNQAPGNQAQAGGWGGASPSTGDGNPFAGFSSSTPTGPENAGSTRPPLLWLALGIVGPVIGIGLLFLHGWVYNVAGWAVAIVLGLGLLVVFTSIDLRRRASPWYLARPGVVAALRLVVAGAAIVVAGVHAYFFADYIARLDIWA